MIKNNLLLGFFNCAWSYRHSIGWSVQGFSNVVVVNFRGIYKKYSANNVGVWKMIRIEIFEEIVV
uniref:Uncharacterized protein n=1 Tax=Physcomitrium patens TaxID=3218 RepID=A0A2K1KQ64_PHYPA|nr:hypothetical protein PHYPA_006821 [Physcomitrium patens]